MADTETAKKHPTDAELLAIFLLLLAQTQKQIKADVAAYLSGTMTISALSDALTGALLQAHTQSVSLGKQLAGIDNTAGDAQFAASVMDGQVTYLEGLLADLQSGKYGPMMGGELPPALAQRLDLYGKALRATADQAWVMSQEPDAQITWVTTAAESCNGCLSMEAGNPYTPATLTSFPGEEECGPNCRCYLMLADGTHGFNID